MTEWEEHSKNHLTTIEEAAKAISAGDVVWLGSGFQVPCALLDEMHSHMENYHDVTLMYNVTTAPFNILFDKDSKKHFRLISFFNLPLERMSGEMGILEYHSCGYDQLVDGFLSTEETLQQYRYALRMKTGTAMRGYTASEQLRKS